MHLKLVISIIHQSKNDRDFFILRSKFHALKCMFWCQNDVLPWGAYVNVDSKSDHLRILTRTGQVAQATGVPWGYLRVKWCHGQPHPSVCLSGEVNSIEAPIFHALYWYLAQGLTTMNLNAIDYMDGCCVDFALFSIYSVSRFNISWG